MRVTRYRGADQIAGKERYSIEYGPLLMAVVGTAQAHLEHGSNPAQFAEQLGPVQGAPLHFSIHGHDGLTLMPYWQIAEEEFTCFPTMG